MCLVCMRLMNRRLLFPEGWTHHRIRIEVNDTQQLDEDCDSKL